MPNKQHLKGILKMNDVFIFVLYLPHFPRYVLSIKQRS